MAIQTMELWKCRLGLLQGSCGPLLPIQLTDGETAAQWYSVKAFPEHLLINSVSPPLAGCCAGQLQVQVMS